MCNQGECLECLDTPLEALNRIYWNVISYLFLNLQHYSPFNFTVTTHIVYIYYKKKKRLDFVI